MKPKLVVIASVAILALLAGCKPKASGPDAVKLVPETERSRHFAAVSSQLELGGTLYGYADIDGDVLKVAPYLQMLADTVAEQQPMAAPFLKQDFAQLLTELGLNDVRAIGLSSVPSADGGFRNRVYLHTPAGRRGLLSGLGGEPTAFTNARLAPEDADLYAESDVDFAALYAALRALVARVAGEPLAGVLETQLQADAAGMGVTPLTVIKSLKGRVTLVLRTDAERTFTVPSAQPFTVPAFQFLARVDGLGGSLDPALAKLPMLAVSMEGTVKVYAIKDPSPIEGLQPVIAVDGAALYIASDAAFLKASLARTGGLEQAPEFRSALAELGEKGNGVTYVSPRLFTQMRRLKELNPQLGEESRHAFDLVLGSLPAPKQPLVAVRTNLPEGILYRARWHRSLKQDVAMVTVYNPVTVGVMAAMAIPAFQKVRAASQEKAFANNLRKTDAAMQQRILTSNAAGADSDSRAVTSTADELKEKAIIENLLRLNGAAFWHMQETGSGVATYAQLVGPDKGIQELRPVDGEDYTRLVIRSSDTHLMVTTKAGKVVRVER